MRYTIGEVSEILNISRDMVRYYEKQGVIQSHRNTSNNYRYYDTSIIFWLLESIQFKNLGINIKNISGVRMDDYVGQLVKHIELYENNLRDEISYRTILIERVNQLKDRISIGRYNIGNYWVTRVPAYYKSSLVEGQGDDYERFTISPQSSAFVFSDQVNPFVDWGVTDSGGRQSWENFIEEQYVRRLQLSLPDDFVFVPGSLCFCTHIDMGAMGDFSQDRISEFKEFAVKHYESAGLSPEQPVTGLLISRGFEDNLLHRILELRLPIL